MIERLVINFRLKILKIKKKMRHKKNDRENKNTGRHHMEWKRENNPL